MMKTHNNLLFILILFVGATVGYNSKASTISNVDMAQFKCVLDTLNSTGDRWVHSQYFLFDITGDGKSELWIKSGSCEADYRLMAYTLESGKPRKIYEGEGGHSDFFIYDGQLVCVMCNTGAGAVITYRYDGEKVEESIVEFSTWNESGTALSEPHDSIADEKLKYWENSCGNYIKLTPFSPSGETSAKPYVGKQFKVQNPDGSEFEYKVNEDGVSVTLIKGYANGSSKLVIPSSVESPDSYFFVTDIARDAFETFFTSPLKGVKELSISEGIQSVGAYCFKNAMDLEIVSLPASLKNISYQMFALCPNLKHVTIAENSELTEIDSFAFQECGNLSNFMIPSSVTKIGASPWMGCCSMEKIELAENNYTFVECEGVIYSDWQGNLIQYPAGKKDKEYHPLFGTKAINESAFYGNPHIERLIFPASLDSISYNAFGNCMSLTDVTFNSIDLFIDRAAFNGCPKLKEITLYGVPDYSTKDGQSKSFDDDVKIMITETLPPVRLPESAPGVLSSTWDYISKMPYFYIDADKVNENIGFPEYLGKGKAAVSGNAGPKPDVLRVLASVPNSYLVLEETDNEGRITRIYLDKRNGKSPRVLYFRGGIGGNDLVVALFADGDLKKIERFISEIKNNHLNED